MESSSFGRLFGVLFSPGKTFRSIAERPTWLVALLALLVSAGVMAYIAGMRTDYRDMMIQGAKEKGQQASEAQLEQGIAMMEKIGPIMSALVAPLFIAGIVLFSAFLYWLAFKFTGSDFSYKSSFAVNLHASMPVVIMLLLSIPVLLSRSTITYADMKRSGGSYLQSNLAFLAPEGAQGWLVALLASVDFFSIWALVLTIIGFRALTRKPTQSVAMTVIVIWLIFIAIRVGWVALFS